MTEYSRLEIERIIQHERAKVKDLDFALRNKCIQRERIEAEIVAMKEDIKKVEDFANQMEQIITEEEDHVIMFGLKLMRKEKRGRKTHDQSEPA